MDLKHVQIKNFKSIEFVNIDFSSSCRVLVGINESGKTNILDALNYLTEKNLPQKKFIRQPQPDEAIIKESYIRFIFELDKSEVATIIEPILSQCFNIEDEKLIVNKEHKTKISLSDFLSSRRKEGVYISNFLNENKYFSTWIDNTLKNYTIPSNWVRPVKDCPANLLFLKGDTPVALKNFLLLDKNFLSNDILPYTELVDSKYISDSFDDKIKEYVIANLPKTLYWSYSPEYLLPAKVLTKEFAGDPGTCYPLKCMFELAGVNDITDEINNALSNSGQLFRNLLRRIAIQATKHFQNVWKDYENIEFELLPDGNNISISIKELNSYELSVRSDGFKRFITFLLLVSGRAKAGLLENTLLLIDEPDTSLHPSGARYLRDELITISKNNYVVFSTHSIFMIDSDNISRHLIVTKKNEITTIKDANESNIVEEEVIYNALGYSIFENLHKKNLIFEGWRDKVLFKTAIKTIPASHLSLRKKFKAIGLCHGEGVKSIMNFTPILELSDRECFIFSDADISAREKQKEYKNKKGYGKWMRYDELLPGVEAITGEDFVQFNAFVTILSDLQSKFPNLQPLIESDLEIPSGKIEALKKWLSLAGIKSDEQKKILDEIKESIFSKLKPSDIKLSYYELLKNLSGTI